MIGTNDAKDDCSSSNKDLKSKYKLKSNCESNNEFPMYEAINSFDP